MPLTVAARCKDVKSTAARLLGLRVRIPPGHGCLSVVNIVCCQAEVSATELITRPEESYRLWCVQRV